MPNTKHRRLVATAARRRARRHHARRLRLVRRRQRRRRVGSGLADVLDLGAGHGQGRGPVEQGPGQEAADHRHGEEAGVRRRPWSPRSSPRTRPATRPTWCRPSTRRCRPWSATTRSPTSSEEVGDAKGKFADGVWQQTTLGTDAVYAIPQDIGPMMFYYREDLFKKYGLTVPKTWDEFAETARALKKKAPDKDLTTFSANDPGCSPASPSRPAPSGGPPAARSGRSASTTRPPRRSPTSGAAWSRRARSTTSRCTPRPGTRRSTPASRSPGSSAVWAPGTLTTTAPDTKGKWAMAPLPQWSAGENVTGSWGGSSTAVTADSKHKAAAAKFADLAEHRPRGADRAGQGERHLPGRHRPRRPATRSPEPPDFFSNQPDFYTQAAEIAEDAPRRPPWART